MSMQIISNKVVILEYGSFGNIPDTLDDVTSNVTVPADTFITPAPPIQPIIAAVRIAFDKNFFITFSTPLHKTYRGNRYIEKR